MDRKNVAVLSVVLLLCTLLANSRGYGWNSDYYRRYWDGYYYQPSRFVFRRYPYRPYISATYDRYRPDSSAAYDPYRQDPSVTYDRYPYQQHFDSRSRYGYNCREGYGYGYECYDNTYNWYPSIQESRRYYDRRYGDYNYDPYRDYYDRGWDRKTVTGESSSTPERPT